MQGLDSFSFEKFRGLGERTVYEAALDWCLSHKKS
jgi:hypothetical protein